MRHVACCLPVRGLGSQYEPEGQRQKISKPTSANKRESGHFYDTIKYGTQYGWRHQFKSIK